MLDPYTGNVTTLLNNYYGTQINSPNDLFIDSVGDIFFTDSSPPHADFHVLQRIWRRVDISKPKLLIQR